MSQCFAMKRLKTQYLSNFRLVETDSPIQIALVCFFPTSKKVPLLNNVRLETQKIRFL